MYMPFRFEEGIKGTEKEKEFIRIPTFEYPEKQQKT